MSTVPNNHRAQYSHFEIHKKADSKAAARWELATITMLAFATLIIGYLACVGLLTVLVNAGWHA